ncbi:MAG: hypothetical protein RI953_2021 [Pseudomonadota bacterium]|jgi:dihydropteroate synthase
MITRNQKGDEKCKSLLDHTPVVQMGILNATPDSFSDGGLHNTPPSALAQAIELVKAGAHIIDVGGASTRPGSLLPDADEEWHRVSGILELLRKQLPDHILMSLDTCSAEVALRAAEHNCVDIINDVAASRVSMKIGENHKAAAHWPAEITTAHVAAHFRLGLIVMHMQGEPHNMQVNPIYANCVEEVASFLEEQVKFARNLGVQWCAVDPGIGFGKTLEHNLSLLSKDGLARIGASGIPVLVGLSRKSFLKTLAEKNGEYPLFHSSAEERHWRDEQSKPWEDACAKWGARIIRTHSIKKAR